MEKIVIGLAALLALTSACSAEEYVRGSVHRDYSYTCDSKNPEIRAVYGGCTKYEILNAGYRGLKLKSSSFLHMEQESSLYKAINQMGIGVLGASTTDSAEEFIGMRDLFFDAKCNLL